MLLFIAGERQLSILKAFYEVFESSYYVATHLVLSRGSESSMDQPGVTLYHWFKHCKTQFEKKLRFLLTTFMWLKVVDVKLNMFQICHETMKTMTKKKSNQSSMYVCFCMAHVGSLFKKKTLN